MPRPEDEQLPDSVILQAFQGVKNTVAAERLGPTDLERAINVDIDDAGQVRRRRGYAKVDIGAWHSLKAINGKVYGVRDGMLCVLNDDYSYTELQTAGTARMCFTAVNDEIYFSTAGVNGVIQADGSIIPWGAADGQGTWVSPVINPTETLGAIRGKSYAPPPYATEIEAYKGRIYLAEGKTLWATELFRYHYVERTINFLQFESEITLLQAMDDGLYVGTEEALHFIKGVLGKFQLSTVVNSPVLRGSGVVVPVDLIHPNARSAPLPTGEAAVLMTHAGILACFDGGTVFNLTHDRVIFPEGVTAAALYRQDMGVNSYVAAVDSAGGPSANTRIGDYVDAEIIRASASQGG